MPRVKAWVWRWMQICFCPPFRFCVAFDAWQIHRNHIVCSSCMLSHFSLARAYFLVNKNDYSRLLDIWIISLDLKRFFLPYLIYPFDLQCMSWNFTGWCIARGPCVVNKKAHSCWLKFWITSPGYEILVWTIYMYCVLFCIASWKHKLLCVSNKEGRSH